MNSIMRATNQNIYENGRPYTVGDHGPKDEKIGRDLASAGDQAPRIYEVGSDLASVRDHMLKDNCDFVSAGNHKPKNGQDLAYTGDQVPER